MQRRKFLVGLGSLAAGGAATLGTSATSSLEAERGITGAAVIDNQANIRLKKGKTHGGKAEFTVVGNGTGDGAGSATNELALKFDSLNPDAFQAFDDVFRINNPGPEDLEVGIFDAMQDVAFYFGEDLPGSAGGLTSNTTRAVSLVAGQTQSVGVTIDTRDVSTSSSTDYSDSSDSIFNGTDGIGGDDDFLLQASEDLSSGPVQLGDGPSGNG